MEGGSALPRVICRTEYCIGCGLCQIYCTVRHSKSGEILRAFREKPRAVPRLVLEQNKPESQAVTCKHCLDAPCLDACISGAMTRNENTGAVFCRPERCVGCWSCVAACSFGAVFPDPEGHGVAVKCDLCNGDTIPQCVLHCPNRALVLESGGERNCG